MKEYKCDTCEKIFTKKCNLEAHKNKKKKCTKISHVIKKLKKENKVLEDENILLKNILMDINLLIKKSEEIKSLLLSQKPTIINNETVNNNNSEIVNNIFIVDFGKEDIDKIDKKLFLESFLESLKDF